MATERRDAGQHRHHGVFTNPADRELSRTGVRVAVVEAGGKLFIRFIDTCRSKQIGRRDNERTVGRDIVVVQDAAQLVAERRLCPGFEDEFGRSRAIGAFRKDIGEVDERPVLARFAIAFVQPRLRRTQLRRQRLTVGRRTLSARRMRPSVSQ